MSTVFVPNLEGLTANAIQDWQEPGLICVLEHNATYNLIIKFLILKNDQKLK